MALLSRLIVLFPLALSIVGIVLSALSLFAGHEEGFLEDYDIVRLNTSMIGQNILDRDRDSNDDNDDEDDDEDKSWFDDIKDDVSETINDIKDDIEDKINEKAGEAAGALADTLGVSEWYSIHIMSACEGTYDPDPTADSPSLNITKCSSSSPTFRLNLTKMIDEELEVGPFDINLADMGWEDSIQDKVDLINDMLLAFFVLYVLGMSFSGLSIIGCVIAFFLASSRLVVFVNFTFSLLAAIAITAGSIIATVAGTKGVDELNDKVERFGVRAEQGDKFLAISWSAAAVMIVACIFWGVRMCQVCAQRRREKKRTSYKETY